ncbi:helix-turn-helix domain-containing protein [Paraburkholderia youngii]|uniref:helix-turn-helix domain-containing protein n=1 Tax=Paraburkholderia youngii TaxID=2782701 RepID=UPI003D2254CD
MRKDLGNGDDRVLLRLADNMRSLRDQRTLSLHALAGRAEIDRKLLRGLEHGSLNPSLKTLERVARAFDISVAGLLGADDVSQPRALFDITSLVALNVRRLRHERDWSAADVESRIRMKAAYVSYIETGRQGCTLRTLIRLAEGFGVDVIELFRPPGS